MSCDQIWHVKYVPPLYDEIAAGKFDRKKNYKKRVHKKRPIHEFAIASQIQIASWEV